MLHSHLAKLIDHTILKPEATSNEIERFCLEARQYEFAALCVNPDRVQLAHSFLISSPVAVCSVVGFPLGACKVQIKAMAAEIAVRSGAREIDMVMNLGAFKDGRFDLVEQDVRTVADAINPEASLKVILEICLLSADEIIDACKLCVQAGAQFVKTSTGFNKSGATVEAVTLMRSTVGTDIGVKAAGGIRDTATAESMVAAGANRLGASASLKIIGI